MFSYLQLPFLQALGYAITNSIWQICLLWLIVILINGIARHSSHVRYITALSAQVAGFVWFLTTLQFYYRHCHIASLQAEQLAGDNATLYHQSVMAGNDNVLSIVIRAEETLPYLSVAYLLLLSVLVVKWTKNFRYTKQLSSSELQQTDSKWQAFVNEMADRLDIMQEVKIYLSSLAKSPMTIGYIKPIILLPIASINCLSTGQLEAVLLHELAHIKRGDYIINILVSITEIILFFNPFTRLLSRTIQRERENCCDDWVLEYQYNPTMYAEALLRIASLQQHGFQMNAVSRKGGDLLQRVKRIVQPVEKRFNYKHQVSALVLITGLLFSFTWLQPAEKNDYQNAIVNTNNTDKKIVVTPMIAQVDNPFFNGAFLFSPSLQKDVAQSIAELDKSIADSAITTSVQQAQIALQKTTPAVLAAVSSGNWQKIINEANEEAAKSIQNIDWQALQANVPRLVDSSLILQSVNMALTKTDRLNGIKKGLADAREQLAALQRNRSIDLHLNLTADYFRQLSENALSTLQQINFKATADSLKAASAQMMKDVMREQKKHQEELKKMQQTEIKKAQDSYKKSLETMRNMSPAAAIAPLPPAPPQNDGTIWISDEPADAQTTTPAADSWSFSEPVFHVTNTTNKISKTIRIVSNSDSATINIVIEIRQ